MSRRQARPRRPARRSTTTWRYATSLPLAPNVLWLTDITKQPTAEGKLYFYAVEDAYSKRIVGYSINSRMTLRTGGRRTAQRVALRGATATIVHSDCGNQFRSHAYVRTRDERSSAAPWAVSVACAGNAAVGCWALP